MSFDVVRRCLLVVCVFVVVRCSLFGICCRVSVVYGLLPVVCCNCPLSNACRLLCAFVVCCLLSAVCRFGWSLFDACCLVFVVCCSFVVARCLLFVVCSCLLFVVCCVFVVCCLLFVVC